jgi:hypothetical protein
VILTWRLRHIFQAERGYFPTVNVLAAELDWPTGVVSDLSYENSSFPLFGQAYKSTFVSLNLQNDWKYLRGLARQLLTS